MTTPEGEGTQSGATGAQSGTGTATGTDNGTTETGTETGTQSGTATSTETVSKAEFEAIRERMKAADRRAADFESKFKQLTDKDLPAAEKLKRDYEDAVKQVETMRATNAKLALGNAFLADNTYEWQNPARALQLIDQSGIEVSEDGTVTGLKDALKALATSDPYLLKNKTQEETPPPGGTAPGNNGSTGASTPSHKALAARFPALSTRVKRS
jgi:Phage minor structural protein GP20